MNFLSLNNYCDFYPQNQKMLQIHERYAIFRHDWKFDTLRNLVLGGKRKRSTKLFSKMPLPFLKKIFPYPYLLQLIEIPPPVLSRKNLLDIGRVLSPERNEQLEWVLWKHLKKIILQYNILGGGGGVGCRPIWIPHFLRGIFKNEYLLVFIKF